MQINLHATRWSVETDTWLVTSVNKGDVPISVVVDTATKDALFKLQDIYNKAPNTVLNCVRKHYRAIIKAIHLFEVDVPEATSVDFSSEPLIGETNVETTLIDTDNNITAVKVTYCKTGDAVRFIQGFLDDSLYEAFSAIAADWASYPKLYYYVLSKYMSRFEAHILSSKEELQ